MSQVMLTEDETRSWLKYAQERHNQEAKEKENKLHEERLVNTILAMQKVIRKQDGCIFKITDTPTRSLCEGCLLHESKVPDNRHSLCAYNSELNIKRSV